MTLELFAVLFTLLFTAMFKALLWGTAENRQFHDTDWGTAGSGILHLSTYHIWMFIFFINTDVGITTSVCYVFDVWKVWFPLLILFTMWNIWALDVTWWTIRHFDVTHLGKQWKIGNFVLHTFPKWNPYDGGTGKAWHSTTDWDAAGLPLLFGTYLWWWLMAFVMVGLGCLIFALI